MQRYDVVFFHSTLYVFNCRRGKRKKQERTSQYKEIWELLRTLSQKRREGARKERNPNERLKSVVFFSRSFVSPSPSSSFSKIFPRKLCRHRCYSIIIRSARSELSSAAKKSFIAPRRSSAFSSRRDEYGSGGGDAERRSHIDDLNCEQRRLNFGCCNRHVKYDACSCFQSHVL